MNANQCAQDYAKAFGDPECPRDVAYALRCRMFETIAGMCMHGKEKLQLWNPLGFEVGDIIRIGGRYCIVEQRAVPFGETAKKLAPSMRVRFADEVPS